MSVFCDVLLLFMIKMIIASRATITPAKVKLSTTAQSSHYPLCDGISYVHICILYTLTFSCYWLLSTIINGNLW